MVSVLRILQRPAAFEAVRWDGSEETAQWIADRFGTEVVETDGDGDDLQLRVHGATVPRGFYVIEQWGSFNMFSAEQLADWQLAAPPVLAEQTPEPEPEPTPDPEPQPEPLPEPDNVPAE